MNQRKCPRCGKKVPSWQPIHLPCLAYRLRYLLVFLAILMTVFGGPPIYRGITNLLSNVKPAALAAGLVKPSEIPISITLVQITSTPKITPFTIPSPTIPIEVLPTKIETHTPYPPLPTSEATPTNYSGLEPIPSNYACADLARVELRVGAWGKIRKYDVSLRTEAKVPDVWDANMVRVLRAGERFKVIGGPVCAYNGTWWQITIDSSTTGWSREYLSDKGRLLIKVDQ